MNPLSSFVINHARFAHETVDGEAIIIDMDKGTYFSLRDTAEVIWRLQEQGLSLAEIINRMAAACGADRDELETAVTGFLETLVAEGILEAVASPGRPVPADEPLPAFTFAAPRFEKLTDMQDLLTMDPIHEVDDTGWPHAEKPAH